jgi:putative ABC transport system ATP-binding protein/lipoprotein-releasing system ATP-binding protein
LEQIEVRDTSKIYKIGDNEIRAVDRVSLTVRRGEFVSIIGHSGSGKTTLLSMIGGILKNTKGEVLYNGTDIYRLPADELSRYRAKKVGYIFQFASLLPVLTAKENLLLPTIFSKNGSKPRGKKAEEYLDMVGLKDKINAYPSQLSGGQQRRVAIARSLMNDPEVVLGDEPTGDLDEETEMEIMDLIGRVNRQNSVTIIFVTHNSELARTASKQLKMSNGSLEEI